MTTGTPSTTPSRPSTTPGGTLWLVATPIGNLGDLPPRAIEILDRAALVCCEDTRRTAKLLQHAGIRADRLAVANDHTEFHRIDDVLATLGTGDDVAIVTDAGTPGVSDPGERLVTAALDAGYAVSAVPGPVAAIVALTISGLPTGRFVVDGFIARKGSERTEHLQQIATEPRTTVLYEAPHRIERTLADLRAACGADRPVAVCRELTKMFETVTRATLGTIDIGEPRGEYVIVLGGAPDAEEPVTDQDLIDALTAELDAGATKRDAVAAVSKRFSTPKNTVYELALTMS